MEVHQHTYNGISVLEIETIDSTIYEIQEILDVVSDYSIKRIVFKREHLGEDFFNLTSGFISSLLQILTQYKIRIGIIGDFSDIEDQDMKAFMYENKQILFKPNLKEVLKVFCKK